MRSWTLTPDEGGTLRVTGNADFWAALAEALDGG